MGRLLGSAGVLMWPRYHFGFSAAICVFSAIRAKTEGAVDIVLKKYMYNTTRSERKLRGMAQNNTGYLQRIAQ